MTSGGLSEFVTSALFWQFSLLYGRQYQLNGGYLRSVSHKCDLGVIVGETLKPHRQCAKAAKSANSIMRAIKESFMNITPTFFEELYWIFIRPHLKYSFQAWRPWLRKDIKLLEDVQRCSTKFVNGLQDIEYEERTQLINLDSLSCRTDKGDMIFVSKILHGFLEGVQWQDFFQMADISGLRGHPLKLRKDRSRLDLRKFTFSQRVVNKWNDLTAEVVSASSVKASKNKLKGHLTDLPRRSPEYPQQNAPSLLMHLCFSWFFYKRHFKIVY